MDLLFILVNGQTRRTPRTIETTGRSYDMSNKKPEPWSSLKITYSGMRQKAWASHSTVEEHHVVPGTSVPSQASR
jgi:hypothetical protein